MSSEDTTGPAVTTGTSFNRGRLWRTLTVLLPANVALYGLYQGIAQVLKPAQVQAIDPDGKVASLALLSAVASIAGSIALPIFGMLSDRTVSRFGKRSPWLVASAVACVGFAFAMGVSTTIVAMAITMCLLWSAAHCYQGVVYAIIPDRIPESARGTASSVVGLGLPLGILIFVNLVARVSQLTGYLLLAGSLVVATLVLVLVDREAPVRARPAAATNSGKADRRGIFSAFKSRDYTMVFVSRSLFFFGFFAVAAYVFYVVTDFIGVDKVPGRSAAGAVATIATISTISQVIAVLIFGKLADVLNRRKLIVGLSAFGMAVGLVVPLVLPTWTGMMIYAGINGASLGVYFTVDIALMSLVLPRPENAGRDLGILAIATSASGTLAPLIAAALINGFHSYAAIFWFSLVCATLGGVTVLSVRGVR